MEKKRVIKSMGTFGSRGWMWETSDGRRCRTNSDGEGLWCEISKGTMVREGDYWKPYKEMTQVSGTSQFSLPQDRKRAMAKVRRLMSIRND